MGDENWTPIPEPDKNTNRIHCVMCNGTWWQKHRYVAPRRGLFGLFARRECLTATCSLCGYVARWRPGTVDCSKLRSDNPWNSYRYND